MFSQGMNSRKSFMIDILIVFNGISTRLGVILYQEVRESHSFYVYMFIFVLLFLKRFISVGEGIRSN